MNGLVKELHFETQSRTRPMPGVNVILKKSGGKVYSNTTETGVFNFFTEPENACLLDIEYPGYEVVDRDELGPVKFENSSSNPSIHILICKFGLVQQIANNYYKEVDARIQQDYIVKKDSILKLYKDNMLKFQQTNTLLLERVTELQTQARLFSNIFSTTDFESVSDNYLNGFKQFKLGNLDSCVIFFNDEFLNKEKDDVQKLKKLKAGAQLMRAEIEYEKGNKRKAETYFKNAIAIDYRYYTFEPYANYLLQQQRWDDALPVITQKLNFQFDPLPVKDSIYTLYQLSRLYSQPQRLNMNKAFYYDSLILHYKDWILSSNDPKMQSVLLLTNANVADYFSRQRYLQKNDSLELKSIDVLKENIHYYHQFNLKQIDSFGVWVPDISEVYYNIGLSYEETLNNKDSASRYYINSVTVARDYFMKDTSDTRLATLLERYGDMIGSESISKKEKIRLLEKGKEYFKKSKQLGEKQKAEITGELDDMISELKTGNQNSDKEMERLLKKMLGN